MNYPELRESRRFEAVSVLPRGLKTDKITDRVMAIQYMMDDSEKQQKLLKLQTALKMGLITEDEILEKLDRAMSKNAESNVARKTEKEELILEQLNNNRQNSKYDGKFENTEGGICELLGITRSGVSKTLRDMESKGLIYSRNLHVPGGRRKVQCWFVVGSGTDRGFGAESYKPPASAISAAKRGLEQRKKYGRGGLSPAEAKSQGIDSGVTRARKIASGKVSKHDVRRMSAFNRHRKNNNPSKKMPDGGPTAGTIAWNLWGGTSGVNWAKKKSAAMNAEDFEMMCRQCKIGNYESCLYGETVDTGGFWLSNCVPDPSMNAETFDAESWGSKKSMKQWMQFQKETEEEVAWGYFHANLYPPNKLLTKIWTFEGKPNGSVEAWWNTITNQDDDEQREQLEEVFERHYPIILKSARKDVQQLIEEHNWYDMMSAEVVDVLPNNGDDSYEKELWVGNDSSQANAAALNYLQSKYPDDFEDIKYVLHGSSDYNKVWLTWIFENDDYSAEEVSVGDICPICDDEIEEVAICSGCDLRVCMPCRDSGDWSYDEELVSDDDSGDVCGECSAFDAKLEKLASRDYNSFTNDMEGLLAKYSQLLLTYETEYKDGIMEVFTRFKPYDVDFDDVDFDAEGLTGDDDIKLGDVVRSYDFCLGGKISVDDCYVEGIVEKIAPVEWCGPNCDHYHIKTIRRIFNGKPTTHEDYYFPVADPSQTAVRRVARWSAESFGPVDDDGILAKALSRARMRSREPRKPLKIEKLPHRDQKSLKDFEAVVIPKTSGYAERAAANHMAIEASEQQQMLLELQTLLKLKIITPEDAFAMMLGE